MNFYDTFILVRNYTGYSVLMILIFLFLKHIIIIIKLILPSTYYFMNWIFANQVDEEINKRLFKLEKENINLNSKNSQLEIEINIIKNKYKEVEGLMDLVDNIIKAQLQNQKEIQILTSKVNIKL